MKFGENVGAKLGENISSAAKDISAGARELGNIEKAALHLKEGLILTSLITGAAWIITGILKKL